MKTVYSLQSTVYRLVGIALLVTCALSLVTSVEAHILKTDGTIGAVLHIDPDDDPIINQPAGFFFEFKDTQNKFDPANCNCIFSIEQSGKQIYSQPLFQGNDKPAFNNANVFYTFTKKDVYQVKIMGQPNVAGAFQPFNLIYDIRVDRASISQTPTQSLTNVKNGQSSNWFSTHLIHFFAAIIIGLFFILALIKQYLSRIKFKPPLQTDSNQPHNMIESSSVLPKNDKVQ